MAARIGSNASLLPIMVILPDTSSIPVLTFQFYLKQQQRGTYAQRF